MSRSERFMEGAIQPFIIRSMLPGDLVPVVEIERESNPSPWSAEQFRAELENNFSSVDLLLVEDEVAAYICSWKIVDELQIQNVATAPRYRRKGLAAKLLAMLLEKAATDGVSRVFLEVRTGNEAARTLYEKFGFTIQGVREKYYADNEDAYLMELDMSMLHS